ncbi:MAG TPA: SDR family oxidoreductase [Bryobacteraceae bacterium]|nr:SDR family oxidoreductase [Bryobacteraceae bacterium]
MFSFNGRTALVSGGTSGIGLAIARAFAQAGATVAAAGLGDLPVGSHNLRFYSLDVTDTSACRQLIASLPAVDFLINAAGIIRREEEYDVAVFQQVMDVNVNGAMRLCTEAREKLIASKGAVVNIASMWTYFGSAKAPAYTASKGAIGQLTKALAVAWAPQGVRVNAVAPGWIATPLTQSLQDDPVRSAPILSRCPMGRWGRPEEVAPPVLFLCSEAAAFINGAILPVDGGYLAV